MRSATRTGWRSSVASTRSASRGPCGGFGFDISKSTLTHHFRTLREAGVIRQERRGTTKLTWLRRDDLDARFPGLLDAVLAASAVPA